MKIDQKKLRELIARGEFSPSPEQLQREQNVFLVGGELPEQSTLETIFDSHYQSNASLFYLTFGGINSFHLGEALARVIKKNFNVHLVGRLDYAAPPHFIERAYAAGVDILDIPLHLFDRAKSKEKGLEMGDRMDALAYARSVFPRWSVASTLTAGEESPCSTMAGVDALLALGVVPLLTLSSRAAHYAPEDVARICTHLEAGWRKKKAAIKPLLPLVHLLTPLVPKVPRTGLRGFIDSIEDRRLLAASDLRRILRVKEVAESFDSAGL